MNWQPAFALVLFGVTMITFCGAWLLEGEQVNKRKRLIWLFVILGLFPLLVFKYYNFLNDSFSQSLAAIGLKFALPGLNWAIPVGISFFSFQAVGYMLDVYCGNTKAEKNILDYLLFVSFFPQVTSGPISTANELLPQIKATHTFDYSQGKQGLKLLLWGMFIKLVIADRLGLYVDFVYATYLGCNGTTCLLASVCYTVQIYCDFCGYSLMAIGIAKLLGFDLADNFKRPYFAVSVTDFWRRWHITLTRWLTQHVYIPLGGNRLGKARTYLNILITFLVSGIWHGANWRFVVWGGLHGFFQIIEKASGRQKYEGNNALVKAFRVLITFLLVNFAWVFFRAPGIPTACKFIVKIFTSFGAPVIAGMDSLTWLMVLIGLLILIFKDSRDEFFKERFCFVDSKLFRWFAYIILFCMVINFGVLDGGQFIYMNF